MSFPGILTYDTYGSLKYFEIISEQCHGYLFFFFNWRAGVCRVYLIQVVGNAMSQTWSDRHRILLVTRARQRLKNWGVSAGAMAAIGGYISGHQDKPGIPHSRFTSQNYEPAINRHQSHGAQNSIDT